MTIPSGLCLLSLGCCVPHKKKDRQEEPNTDAAPESRLVAKSKKHAKRQRPKLLLKDLLLQDPNACDCRHRAHSVDEDRVRMGIQSPPPGQHSRRSKSLDFESGGGSIRQEDISMVRIEDGKMDDPNRGSSKEWRLSEPNVILSPRAV